MLLLIAFSAMLGCTSADNEIIIVPEDYVGYIVIIYEQSNGKDKEYQTNSRVYRIPSTGVLATQFSNNPGWSELPKFYNGSVSPKNAIPFITDFEDVPKDEIVAFGGSSGVANKDLAGKEVVRYKEYYIGTKSQIERAIKKADELNLFQLKIR